MLFSDILLRALIASLPFGGNFEGPGGLKGSVIFGGFA